MSAFILFHLPKWVARRAKKADFFSRQLHVRMVRYPDLDGQRSVRQVTADSHDRGRVRDARVRRSLRHREQRAARVFDAIPRSHLHEEGAGTGAGVRSGHGDHHAGGLVRRASAQEPVVHQVLGAYPAFALSQEGHAHVSLESLRDRRGRPHVEKGNGAFRHRGSRYLASA
jgi:hypothetical protein